MIGVPRLDSDLDCICPLIPHINRRFHCNDIVVDRARDCVHYELGHTYSA